MVASSHFIPFGRNHGRVSRRSSLLRQQERRTRCHFVDMFAALKSANAVLKTSFPSHERGHSVTCHATPAPAWPGRAVAPQTAKKLGSDGPKVRRLGYTRAPTRPLTRSLARLTARSPEILPARVHGIDRDADAGHCRGAPGQICRHGPRRWRQHRPAGGAGP